MKQHHSVRMLSSLCLNSLHYQTTDYLIMQQEIDSVDSWSSLNHCHKYYKTKEMLIGSIQTNPPPLLQLDGQPVEHVTSNKLLGLHVTDSLQWNEQWTCVIIVFQDGIAPPFTPATKACSNVIRWFIISACRKTCYWIRIYSEVCYENYIRHQQWRLIPR